MKLQSANDQPVFVCDFCGASSLGKAAMFVSSLNDVAICKPCVDSFPFVMGTVIWRRLDAKPVPQPPRGVGEG